MPPDKTREYAIAMVTMSNEAEATQVAARIGDMHSGKCAVIQLLQEARPIPASLLRAVNSDSGLSSP
jgi:DNA gyrase inhibitor GyrI